MATQTGEEALGTVSRFLDATMCQERVVELVNQAKGLVYVLAYTFDCWALVEALIGAKQRGCDVRIGIDRRFLKGGTCREMLPCCKKLVAHGVWTVTMSGGSLRSAYESVGRAAVGGPGIQHSKCALVDGILVHGSTNWTAASRGNLELSSEVVLTKKGREEVEQLLKGRLPKGEFLM